jgi:hypothetical protein
MVLMKKLFMDIDGVCRDLHGAMDIEYSTEWFDPVFIEKYEEMKKTDPVKLFQDAPAFKETCKNISYLIRIGVDIKFLTGSPVENNHDTFMFLVNNLPAFAFDKIIHVNSMEEKLQYLINNPDHMLYDDYPHFNDDPRFDQVKDRIVLCVRPWNQNFIKEYVHYAYHGITLKQLEG